MAKPWRFYGWVRGALGMQRVHGGVTEQSRVLFLLEGGGRGVWMQIAELAIMGWKDDTQCKMLAAMQWLRLLCTLCGECRLVYCRSHWFCGHDTSGHGPAHTSCNQISKFNTNRYFICRRLLAWCAISCIFEVDIQIHVFFLAHQVYDIFHLLVLSLTDKSLCDRLDHALSFIVMTFQKMFHLVLNLGLNCYNNTNTNTHNNTSLSD